MKRGKRSAEQRDKDELQRAINALQATQHNPVEWGAIVKFVAPLIARIATRYAMTLLSRKLNRRISPKIREDTVASTADKLAELVIKRVPKSPTK